MSHRHDCVTRCPRAPTHRPRAPLQRRTPAFTTRRSVSSSSARAALYLIIWAVIALAGADLAFNRHMLGRSSPSRVADRRGRGRIGASAAPRRAPAPSRFHGRLTLVFNERCRLGRPVEQSLCDVDHEPARRLGRVRPAALGGLAALVASTCDDRRGRHGLHGGPARSRRSGTCWWGSRPPRRRRCSSPMHSSAADSQRFRASEALAVSKAHARTRRGLLVLVRVGETLRRSARTIRPARGRERARLRCVAATGAARSCGTTSARWRASRRHVGRRRRRRGAARHRMVARHLPWWRRCARARCSRFRMRHTLISCRRV